MNAKMVPYDSMRDPDKHVFEGHGPRAIALRQYAENENFFDPNPHLLAERIKKVADVFDISEHLCYDYPNDLFDGLRLAMDRAVEDKNRTPESLNIDGLGKVDISFHNNKYSWVLTVSALDNRVTGSTRSYSNLISDKLFQISHVKESYVCTKPYPYINQLNDNFIALMQEWLIANQIEVNPDALLDVEEFKAAILEMIASLNLEQVRSYVDQSILKHNNPAARVRMRTAAFTMDVFKSDEGQMYALLHTRSIVNRYRYGSQGEISLGMIIDLQQGTFMTQPEYCIEMIRDNPMPWKNLQAKYYNCATRLWMPGWIEEMRQINMAGFAAVELIAAPFLKGLG